jgi:hypothetical protein
MSLSRPKARLRCWALEDRTTPAVTASLNSGSLVLTGDNTGNDVLITVNPGNMVDVSVNGTSAGSFHPTVGLFATMGTGNDKVELFMHGNTLALTYVVLSGGDGNDQLLIDQGNLQASVWMLGGNGDDTLTIGSASVSGSVVMDGGAGNDTGVLGSAGVGGGAWVSGVQNLSLGGTKFNGNVVILPTEALPASVSFDANVIGGSVYYFGTSAADQVAMGSGTSVAGTTILSLGDGTNSVRLDPATALQRTMIFGGGGDDTVTVGSGATTTDFDIVLGNGTNSVTFGGATVTGNLRIWGGDGADSFTNNAHDSVTGNFSVYFGNGANSFTGAGNVGGTFTYFGGSGVDTVSITGARSTSYAVVLSLGDGDDTFTYTHVNGNLDPASFNIDFGGGNDTFNHNVPITWPSTIVGL